MNTQTAGRPAGAARKIDLRSILPVVGLAAIIVVFSVATGGSFLNPSNLATILNQSFTLILAALGASFIYAHGSLDVSLGSVCMMSCICCVHVARATGSAVLTILTAVGVCLICGVIVAVISCKLNVMAFVASLCVSFVCQGLAGELVATGEIIMPDAIATTFNQPWIKVIVLIAAVAVCYILFEHTKIGHYNKAIGGNAEAARQSGIQVDRYKLIAYIICSITLGISSFFLICRVSAAATTTGSGLHMDVMLAVILGGMSIRGGPKSNIHAPVIGSLITYILTNGFTLCGVSVYWVQFLKGVIFLAVIILVFERKHRGALPS